MDMELVQFHPTGMVSPEDAAGTLVTEAVRGEGGVLRNADGERFMERYDPERLELSTRDRVALANYTEIAEGRGTPAGGVLLDVTHVPRETLLERLPRMYRQFLDLAMLDITSTPMEVAPTAHYSMGGVVVEPDTHLTDVEGLYAVGECASGLHGANRLGGNSLVEGVVFGRRVGAHAAAYVRDVEVALRDRAAIAAAEEEVDATLAGRGEEFARPLQRAVRDTMTEHCGVVRTEEGLAAGLARLDGIAARAGDLEVRPDIAGYADLVHAFDLQAMLLSGRATMLAARERRETRGAHNRADFPDQDPDQKVNLVMEPSLAMSARPVPRRAATSRRSPTATSSPSSGGCSSSAPPRRPRRGHPPHRAHARRGVGAVVRRRPAPRVASRPGLGAPRRPARARHDRRVEARARPARPRARRRARPRPAPAARGHARPRGRPRALRAPRGARPRRRQRRDAPHVAHRAPRGADRAAVRRRARGLRDRRRGQEPRRRTMTVITPTITTSATSWSAIVAPVPRSVPSWIARKTSDAPKNATSVHRTVIRST
jgi:hypothetical protein